jgi:di/tricarboxylate transporter
MVFFESLFLLFDVEHRHRHLVEYPTDTDNADNVDASVDAAATATAVGTIAAWEPIVTLLVIVLMFGVLVLDIVGTDSVMLTALAFFYLSGIINTEEALRGFNSQGLLTVLVLFVVAEGLNKTGALNWYVGKLFGTPKSISGAQMRVMFPITLLSGFINDTPLVMITMPIVIQWARKMNIPLRFVLIPLSFAAVLGGVSHHNFVCAIDVLLCASFLVYHYIS